MNEHEHQRIVVATLRKENQGLIIFAIPNGGGRSKVEAARLKDEGVLAGVPDLFIAAARNGYNGLFLEMKSETGSASTEQKRVIGRLLDAGFLAVVCRGYADALAVARRYLLS